MRQAGQDRTRGEYAGLSVIDQSIPIAPIQERNLAASHRHDNLRGKAPLYKKWLGGNVRQLVLKIPGFAALNFHS